MSEVLLALGLFGAFIALQAWILPKLGFRT